MDMDLKEFCGEPLLDFQTQIHNTTYPTFSNCFQQIICTIVPCSYLWLSALPYYLSTWKKHSHFIAVSNVFKAKMLITLLLWIFAWTSLTSNIVNWSQSNSVPSVDFVAPLVLGASMALALLLTHYDRLNGVRSSGLLTGYWFLFFLSWMIIFKEKIDLIVNSYADSPESLLGTEVLQCVIFFLSYLGVAVNFILCFFVDNPPAFQVDSYGKGRLQLSQCHDPSNFHPPSPQLSATFISKIWFCWMTRMLSTGYKRPLVDSDLWQLNKKDRYSYITKRFDKNWNSQLNKTKEEKIGTFSFKRGSNNGKQSSFVEEGEVLFKQPKHCSKGKASLFVTLMKTFVRLYLISGLVYFLHVCCLFTSPQLLNYLIAFISSDDPQWYGYFLAISMFIVALVDVVLSQQYFYISNITGLRIRTAVISAIYQKTLVLSNSARKKSTVGEIVNLMSVDAQRFVDAMNFIHCVWSVPFEISLALYFLWTILGPSVLAGLVVMVLLIPINVVFASKARTLQARQMRHKDERIKMLNEILNGIKVLKMYAWEMSFQDKITEIRTRELRELRHSAFLTVAEMFTFLCAPFSEGKVLRGYQHKDTPFFTLIQRLQTLNQCKKNVFFAIWVSLATFAVYVLSDDAHVLDAQKIFVSLFLFNLLRLPLAVVPMTVTIMVQTGVGLKRIESFLNRDEVDPSSVDRNPGESLGRSSIVVRDGTFKWDLGEKDILSKIDLSVAQGSLVAVVGQVGCGKSSLLSSLLGEMEKITGYVGVKGSVAYVPQQPWIQNMSIRENVTLGTFVASQRYQDAIRSCELEPDLAMFPAGDHTEIGERGINLSGGQKQRVSLARAICQDSDVYLLDDPLSSVDSQVGRKIFENVIGPNGCLKSKTRVLVTHGLTYLPQADQIIVLVQGRITEIGTYDELLENFGAFSDFLKVYAQKDEDSEEGQSVFTKDALEEIDFKKLSPDEVCSSSTKPSGARSTSSDISEPSNKVVSSKNQKEEYSQHLSPQTDASKLIEEEKVETGNIHFAVVRAYVKAIGFVMMATIVLFTALQTIGIICSNIWLSEWSKDAVNANGTQNGTEARLAVYGALGFCQALLVLITSIALAFGTVGAAASLHDVMLTKVFRAPMSFFDTTPLGRIINRFSLDLNLIEEHIRLDLEYILQDSSYAFAIMFFITYTTPVSLTATIPILVLYFVIQRFYVRTSRQLKRLESASRSPIYSHFSETVTGVSSIRAYSLQQNFILQNEARVETNQMALYPNTLLNRWLATRINMLSSCIILSATVFAVAARGAIEPGLVGLSVSFSSEITKILTWVVEEASDLEANIVAVERISEYTHLEQEAPLLQAHRPDNEWPSDGNMKFKHFSTRYRKDLDLVIKDISFDIEGKEKIGIVGRTGAGKSSLTLALFRIIEPSTGTITIDGEDISKIGLQDLRSKLSIIPQDPLMFSGSLRINLDPFGLHTDQALWDALEHSHLTSFVQSLPAQLDHEVKEGGNNMSVGQRQLVCLARALLRRSKILVLDEATAAVDLETDKLIQVTIRTEFSDCTICTIAHRLNTIMDSTRILVLDNGRIVEFDTPSNLLNARGTFFEMARDVGLA